MKHEIVFLLPLMCLLISCQTNDSTMNFQIPNLEKQAIHPVEYLERYKIAIVNAKLQNENLMLLNKFIIDINKYCIESNNQSYYIHTNCPIYELFKKQYPAVHQLEREGKHLIYLGDWADFANKQLPSNSNLP